MQTLKLIAINIFLFCTVIIVIEIIGQFAYLAKTGRVLFLQEITSLTIFEPHPFLAGRPKESVSVTRKEGTITTTAEHTRWTGAPQADENLIRVALLGGSTTFGNGVTDTDTWPALLQGMLGEKYAVTNYGVPGYTTAENIIQLALIVPAKRPHLVIFYEGWNDIKNYHEEGLGTDYYKHGMLQYRALGTPNLARQSRELRETFAIINFSYRISELILTKPDTNLPEFELFNDPDEFVDAIYLRNIQTLKLMSANMGAFAIFIPQVINKAGYKGTKVNSGWSRNIRDEKFPALMDRFNSSISKLCDQQESDCRVLDEALDESWHPNDFVDRGHLSRSGGIKFARIVAEAIRNLPDSAMP